jgi:hypothetical protein
MGNIIQTLIQEQLEKVANLEAELATEQQHLTELETSAVAWAAAEAAQRKIEEGNRELEEAIAQMHPDIAAMYRGDNNSVKSDRSSEIEDAHSLQNGKSEVGSTDSLASVNPVDDEDNLKDWFEIEEIEEIEIEEIEDENKWVRITSYDKAENGPTGHAVYFRYADAEGGYSAIALIKEERASDEDEKEDDPRSWAIEAFFDSFDSALIEAQNYMSRILEGEFDEPEIDESGIDESESKVDESESKVDESDYPNEDIRRAIAKVFKGQKIDRVEKKVLQDAAYLVGASTEGTKENVADAIRNSDAVQNGVVISGKFVFPGELEAEAKKA